nr:DUF2514 family protein [Janthinobacterium sp. Marseille]
MNIYWKVGSYFLAIAMAIGVLSWYGSKKYDQGFSAREAIATKTALVAEKAAREKEASWQSTLKEANDAANKREETIRADATAARAAAGRLHNDLADLRRKLPQLTEQAVRQYADAASVVFGECTAKYVELAETADRIDSDRQKLEDAWPK